MIKTYKQCIDFLHQHINKTTKHKFGNERLKYLLELLDNPQNNYPTIHIAGTSWKGATAYTTSKILETHGYKIGLHVSPHLLDIRERFQINNKLISEKKVINTLNKMISAITKCNKTFFWQPTYFEITLTLCYMLFKEEKIDIAIIEAGCGWLFDWTNTCNPKEKICIITKQGLDHEHILWNTIEEITFNDAGIIKKNNIVISLNHDIDTSRQIIKYFTRINNWELTLLTKSENYKIKKSNETWTQFSYQNNQQKRHNFKTNLLWKFQIENICLALKTSESFLEKNNSELDIIKTKNILNKLNRKWRFEKFKIWNKTIIIDGAHNPQKMDFFIQSLKEIYPKQKFYFLITIKKNKKYEEMLNHITPLAEKITTTNFLIKQDFFLTALWEDIYKKYFEQNNFENRTHETNPEKCLEKIINSTNKEVIVITGSLYLLSFIYPTLKKYL